MSETVFARPDALLPVTTHYCPGCGHGNAHKMIGEAVDEVGQPGGRLEHQFRQVPVWRVHV